MINVTTKQLQIISAYQERKFIQMLASEVKERFNLDISEEPNLLSVIEGIIMEARLFEFEYDDDIEQYVYLKFIYSSFKKPYSSDLVEILRYPDRNPEIKIDELINYFEKE